VGTPLEKDHFSEQPRFQNPTKKSDFLQFQRFCKRHLWWIKSSAYDRFEDSRQVPVLAKSGVEFASFRRGGLSSAVQFNTLFLSQF
jgi:hypothetical protein